MARAVPMKPIKYKIFDSDMCALVYKSTNVTDENAICASADGPFIDNELGAEGDSFVIRIGGPQATTPIIVVGLDVTYAKQKLGLFLNLYPYLQWIVNTIAINARY